MQRAKKVVCVSPGLVDFAIGLVNSVLNLPEGQVSFLGNSNYRRTVINAAYQKIFRASTYEHQLARMASRKNELLCTVLSGSQIVIIQAKRIFYCTTALLFWGLEQAIPLLAGLFSVTLIFSVTTA